MLTTFGLTAARRLGLRLVMGRDVKCRRQQRGMRPRLSAARPAWSPLVRVGPLLVRACLRSVRACPPSVRADGLSAACRPPDGQRTAGGRRRTSCGRTVRRAADEAGTERGGRSWSSEAFHARVAQCGSSSAASCTRAALAPNRRCETGIGSALEPAVSDRSTSKEFSREVSVVEALCTRSSIAWRLSIEDLNCRVLNDTVRHG
jgi:hypothetical protein